MSPPSTVLCYCRCAVLVVVCSVTFNTPPTRPTQQQPSPPPPNSPATRNRFHRSTVPIAPTNRTHVSVVFVSLAPGNAESADCITVMGPAHRSGATRSTLDVSGGSGGGCASAYSPKHRASIVASTAMSLDTSLDAEHAFDAHSSSATFGNSSAPGSVSHLIQHQQSLDQSLLSSGGAQSSAPLTRLAIDAGELPDIVAESLDAMLDAKAVREKRLEMEKKLDTLRKKHDKEKLKVAAAMRSGEEPGRRTKFYMNNKLVKRLSSKNMYVEI